MIAANGPGYDLLALFASLGTARLFRDDL